MVTLNENEKKYLFSKVEYTRKKRAVEKKDSLYLLLNTESKADYSKDEVGTIMKSLDFRFKQKMINKDKIINKDVFISIKTKFDKELAEK